MVFPYIIQLQNIDTSQKNYHLINSNNPQQVYNNNKQLNRKSIIQYILMYDPQIQQEMLLIMYKQTNNNQQQEQWNFMTDQYCLDLKDLKLIDQSSYSDQMRQSKFNSVILKSNINNSGFGNSLIKSNSKNNNNKNQIMKIILSVRYQCQLWVDDDNQQYQTIQNNNSALGYKSNKHDIQNYYLAKKIKQNNDHIKEMQTLLDQMKNNFQAESLGINIFWASPIYSRDKIYRNSPKGQQYKKQDQKQQKVLKYTVSCPPYIKVITDQITQNQKKIILNIQPFNSLTFARRNVFKIVYLICHTQTVKINQKDFKKQFKKNQFDDFSLVDQLARKSVKPTNNDQQNKIKKKVEETQKSSKYDKSKKSDSFKDSFLGIQEIEEDQSQHFQSPSLILRRTNSYQIPQIQLQQQKPRSFLKNVELTESRKLIQSQRQIVMEQFQLQQFNVYKENQFQFLQAKRERSKKSYKNQSISSSKKSESMKQSRQLKNSRKKQGNNKISQSKRKTKQIYENQNLRVKFQVVDNKNNLKNKKYQKNKLTQKYPDPNTDRKNNQQKQNKKKKTVTYFIGQTKAGELQKITHLDLDDMLNYKKRQNIELLILHTSYSYAHLPIFKKHSNNIILINSNPIYPEASCIYFMKYLFRYLLECKNIQFSYQKAFKKTFQAFGERINGVFNLNTINSNIITKNYLNLNQQQNIIRKNKTQQQDPFYIEITKKYTNHFFYTCCCYHQHQKHCYFDYNRKTSRYSDSHYFFHFKRCNCHHSNIMQHSCQQKFQISIKYDTIDKKKYKSGLVYDCCCLGTKLGKYKYPSRNTEYNYLNSQYNQNIIDPHSPLNKFKLIKTYQKQQQKRIINRNKQLNEQQLKVQTQKRNLLQIGQGQIQGDCSESFLKSIQYLSQKKLIGNGSLIVEVFQFYIRKDIKQQNQIQNNQIQNRLSWSSGRTNSRIFSTSSISINNNIKMKSRIEQKNNINQNQERLLYANQPMICNIYGQDSSGKKTIAIYIANMLVFRHIFIKYQIQYFQKVQQIKYLHINRQNSILYILIHKQNKKKYSKIQKNEQIQIRSQNLPDYLNAIIITNRKIKFQNHSIKIINLTPKPLNNEQIKNYIKINQHLSQIQKLKLNQFMILTKIKNEKGKGKQFGLFANQIDPFQIIQIVKNSNYQKTLSKNKDSKYLQNLQKIDHSVFDQYVIIIGIVKEIINYYKNHQKIKKLKQIQHKIHKFLQQLINQNKGFFWQFDHIKKSKKQKDQNRKKRLNKQQYQNQQINHQQINSLQQQQSKIKQQQQLQIINFLNIELYYNLIYQKFQTRLKNKSLQIINNFISFTNLNKIQIYSVKNQLFSEIKFKNYQKNKQYDINYFKNRNIIFQQQFYDATTQNPNSFICKILGKQLKQFNVKNDRIRINNHDSSKIRIQSKQSIFSISNKLTRQKDKHGKDTNNIVGDFFKFYSSIILQKDKMKIHQNYQISQQIGRNKSMNLYYSHEFNQHHNQIQLQNLHLRIKSQIITNYDSPKKGHKNNLNNLNRFSQHNNKYNQQSQLHLKLFASAGLRYLRGIICSYLTYNLFEPKQALNIIKSSLIFINNVIILMKAYNYKNQKEQHINQSSDQQSNSQSCQKQDQKQDQLNQKYQNNIHKLKNKKISLEEQLIKRTESQRKINKQNNKSNNHKVKDKKQNDLKQPFSVKYMLYLLHKIRIRCDQLILYFTNSQQKIELYMTQKLRIICQLYIIQLHIINIFKGQNYQQKLAKIYKLQKNQRYLISIFYDKNKSMKYFRQKDIQIQQILQNQILLAYVLFLTNGGRKKINQNIWEEFQIMKNILKEKSNRKNSLNQMIDKKMQLSNLKELSQKMKILQKMCQNKDIFKKIYQVFYEFGYDTIPQKQSNNLNHSQNFNQEVPNLTHNFYSADHKVEKSSQLSSISTKNIKITNFHNETQIFIYLIEKNQIFQQKLIKLKTFEIYLQICKLKRQLLVPELIKILKYCPRYLHQFYNDLLNRIQKKIQYLTQTLIIFLTADPIQTNKNKFSQFKKSSQISQNNYHQSDRKKIQFQGKNKTIIISEDSYQLNQILSKNKFNNQLIYQKDQQNHQNLEISSINFNQSMLLQHNLNHIIQNNYSQKYFAIKKKLNQFNIKQLHKNFGCKYLCIDTTMGVINSNQIIGQNENGQTLIFKKTEFAEKIRNLPGNFIFICLPRKSNLAQEIMNKNINKEIIYFDFQSNYIVKNQQQDNQLTCLNIITSNSSRTYKLQTQQLNSYRRLIMQFIVRQIISYIINYPDPYMTIFFKQRNALNYIINNYQFNIKNQKDQIIFNISNKQLRKSIYGNNFKLEQEQIQPSKLIRFNLYKNNIVTVAQIQDVKKNILNNKIQVGVQDKKKKNQIKQIHSISTFQQLINILKFYLKDKQGYQKFYFYNLQRYKNQYSSSSDYKDLKQSCYFPLKYKKSTYSHNSSQHLPTTISRQQSKFSIQSSNIRKKQNKYKDNLYDQVRYMDRWKSQFLKILINDKIFNLLLSQTKGLIMFYNSQLFNDKNNDKQQWAKNIFDDMFNLQIYEKNQQFNRVIYIAKVALNYQKQNDKKMWKQAILYFMENKDK